MVAPVGTVRPGGARLVERDAELALVTDALAHPPAIVLLEGEPGIGKTRLVREALAAPELSGRQVLKGEAHPVPDPYPLGPLVSALLTARLPPVDALSPVVGALRGLLPERADELPAAPEPLPDPISERHRTVRAFVELLSALGPAILVLEDLHWADDRTLEVLEVLGARPPDELATVLTYRGSDAPQGCPLRQMLANLATELVKARVHLRPLSEGGVGALVAGLLGTGGVSEEFSSYLLERSGGIPFVVEEDVRLLVERGLVAEQGGEWTRRGIEELEVPPSVGDAVTERASRLSESARAALEAAAVVGVAADESLLGEVCGIDPADTAAGLSEALASGLVRERGAQVVFRHGLARQAIYDAIPGPHRRRMHLAAARALEATGDESALGQLTHHYRAAGDGQPWVRSAEAAADLAHALGEDATAYRYLRDLLESDAVPPTRRADLTIKLARSARASPGDLRATVALLGEALSERGLPPLLQGELRLWLGQAQFQAPETAGAGYANIRASVEDLEERPELQARALSILGIPTLRPEGTFAEHLPYLKAARAAAERAADPEVRAAVAADEAAALMEVADPTAWQSLEELPSPTDSAQVNRQILRGLSNVAHAALDLGHYRTAWEIAARGLRLGRELHVEMYAADFRAADLLARWAMGEIEGMEEEAGRLSREDYASTALDGEQLRGEILLAHGKLDEAHEVLARVAERRQRLGEPVRAIATSARVVRIARARRDEIAARATAERMLELVASKQIWVWAGPLMPFAPLEVIGPLLEGYRAGIAGRDAPLANAALPFAEGRIAEEEGEVLAAAAVYARARQMYAALPDPRLAAHAAEAEGRCRMQLGGGGAEQLLRSAWRAFTELDAPWEANRIKQLMRRAGLSVPHRRGRRSYRDELSPREREVVQRAAEGLTNREIAEELFLSHRTAEYHLGNAMRKLGVSSRRELRRAQAQASSD